MRILLIFTLLFLASCLGKVEDANPNVTKGTNTGDAVLSFDGIYAANSISNDKAEILFYPVSGDPRDFTYVVNYDGATANYSFPGETLRPDYRGLLKVKIHNLEINKSYIFNVQVKNQYGIISSSKQTRTIKTYANITANFEGIANVKNLAGSDGKNSIIVEWPAAERQGSEFLKKEIDPVLYEIILIDSNSATPIAFDDETFVSPTRIVNYVDGLKIRHQVNGLKPGTKYYVRVRAIHHGYTQYGSSVSYKKEQNSDYLTIETLSDQLSDVDIDIDSFNVQLPDGNLGLFSLETSWELAKGAIDHYRLYIKKNTLGTSWGIYKNGKDDICDGVETNDSAYTCIKIDNNTSERVIADLEPYSEYDISLLSCLNVECSSGNYIEYNNSSPYKTAPPVAPFAGIEEVQKAKFYWSLDEIFLSFPSPNLNSGVADGLLVEVKERSSGSPSSDTFLNHPIEPNTSDLTIANFDFANDNLVSIRGVELDASEPYCFSMLPYTVENGSVVVSRSGEVTKCLTPTIDMPDAEDFPGIDNAVYDASTKSVTLSWAKPAKGIFNKYAVFIKVGGSFNFGDAVGGAASYYRYEAEYSDTTMNFAFLPSGTYSFGVITYFDLTDEYSIFNGNIRVIVVD